MYKCQILILVMCRELLIYVNADSLGSIVDSPSSFRPRRSYPPVVDSGTHLRTQDKVSSIDTHQGPTDAGNNSPHPQHQNPSNARQRSPPNTSGKDASKKQLANDPRSPQGHIKFDKPRHSGLIGDRNRNRRKYSSLGHRHFLINPNSNPNIMRHQNQVGRRVVNAPQQSFQWEYPGMVGPGPGSPYAMGDNSGGLISANNDQIPFFTGGGGGYGGFGSSVGGGYNGGSGGYSGGFNQGYGGGGGGYGGNVGNNKQPITQPTKKQTTTQSKKWTTSRSKKWTTSRSKKQVTMNMKKETSSVRQPRRYPPRIRINDNFPPRLTPGIDQDLGHLCKRGEPLLNIICGPSEGMCPINYECDMRRGLDEFGKCCLREDLCPDQTLALSRGVCRTNTSSNDCPPNFRCIPIALNFGVVNMCCNAMKPGTCPSVIIQDQFTSTVNYTIPLFNSSTANPLIAVVAITIPIPSCAGSCIHDFSCPGMQKCCQGSNGCPICTSPNFPQSALEPTAHISGTRSNMADFNPLSNRFFRQRSVIGDNGKNSGIGNFMVPGNKDSSFRDGLMRSGRLGNLARFSSRTRGMPLMEGLYYDDEEEIKGKNNEYSNVSQKERVVRRNLAHSDRRDRKNKMASQVENGAQSASNPVMMTGLFGGQSAAIKSDPQKNFDQTAYQFAADMASMLKSKDELHRRGKLNDEGSIFVPGDQAAMVDGISGYESEQMNLNLQPEWISALFSNLSGKTGTGNKNIDTGLNTNGGDYSGVNGNFIGIKPSYFSNYQNEEPLIRVSETKIDLESPDSQNMLNGNSELDGSDSNNPYFNPHYDPYQGGADRMIQNDPQISSNNPSMPSLSMYGIGSMAGGAQPGNQMRTIGSYPSAYNSYNLPPRYSAAEKYPSNPAQLVEAYKGQHLPIALQIKANEMRLKSKDRKLDELGQKLDRDNEDQVNSAGDEYANDALFGLVTKKMYKSRIKSTMDPIQFLLPFIMHMKDKKFEHHKMNQPILLKG
ncbi:unnamed protein product [Gordionus sp. m RMFG-2023]|uniref:uncharacterized protein LOC135924001 n=1 Tax=Gordionus sp. m RMFG-2023 TaxID=3053472 RepID=UPI0030E2D959